ncbi:NADP-dependent oxidoreductase [Paenibacillus kyungheensis]|uniref:NADP-dependent oxidoreductase n=1 Tax=Paenibacillus kyungheensis TaxID=1452732 RepID=A0AAX3LX80_9BACL|nr:NADP-dependent oxidoreductase [Paenibacillus kyungheensis]WCT54240.1 NADP-dependent oxidoreductase [Paenibacillus kyungheensis]
MPAPEMMHAIRVHAYGNSEKMHYENVLMPKIEADEVLIKVSATAFNPLDHLIRMGVVQETFPHKLPYIPNVEVSGTITEIGKNVKNVKVGEPVFALLNILSNGAAAEYVATKAEYVATAPKKIKLPEVAALPVGALTAWQALFDHGHLESGQRVLIAGAAGGVGTLAVQLAKWKGAYVIGTASEASFPMLKEIGIDELIDYNQEMVEDRIEDKLDLIFNLSPEGTNEVSNWLHLLREGGTFVSVTSPADEAVAKELKVNVVNMSVQQSGTQLAQIAALADEGVLKPVIAEKVKLKDLPELHHRAEVGTVRGKVLITVAE